MKQIQTKYATQKLESQSTQFNYDDYDYETFNKCQTFLKNYLSQTKHKKPTCYYCELKGDIICEKCQEFYYCSQEHQNLEWRLFHFLECNLIQLFKDIHNNGLKGCSSKKINKSRILFL